MFRAATPTVAAASTSAEGMMMKGSLPPNSITVFLIEAPAAAPTLDPAASLPVNVTAAMRSSSTKGFTIFEGINKVWKAPGGKPASNKISSMLSAERGTLEACLRSPTLPAMSAGAAKRKTCQNGKFHGMIARTGPIGRNRT